MCLIGHGLLLSVSQLKGYLTYHFISNLQKLCYTGFLFDYVDEETQNKILSQLLISKYVGIRRKGYRKLRQWNEAYTSQIEKNWFDHNEIECAKLIINNFPVEYLINALPTLIEKVIDSYYLARLFIRISQEDLTYLSKLEEIDDVAFTYVSTKLEISLDNKQAISIFENNRSDDDKLGLLIWCFGKMNLWNVLEHIHEQSEQLLEERIKAIKFRLRS